MLPDFSKLKSELTASLRQFMQRRIDFHLGPLSEARKIHLLEGDRNKMIRQNGDIEPFLPAEVKTVISWNETELTSITLEDVLIRLDEAAKKMAEQMARQAYASLTQTAERVGKAIDNQNPSARAELILEGLSRISIDFGPDGMAQMPSLITNPNQEEEFKKAMDELTSNPDLNDKFREIIEAKKEEWRVREASRRLVG